MITVTDPWIFLSYRRADGGHWIGKRICRELDSTLGERSTFIDIGSIEIGSNFPDILRKTLDQCMVLLVLITPGWNSHRLSDEHDWVRMEIRTALSRGMVVLPVVLDGADLPRSAELPEDIAALASVQACFVESRSEDAFAAAMGILKSVIMKLAPCNLTFSRPAKDNLVV